jgi:hypothetical protein
MKIERERERVRERGEERDKVQQVSKISVFPLQFSYVPDVE